MRALLGSELTLSVTLQLNKLRRSLVLPDVRAVTGLEGTGMPVGLVSVPASLSFFAPVPDGRCAARGLERRTFHGFPCFGLTVKRQCLC